MIILNQLKINFGSFIDKALSNAAESISFKIVFKAFNDSYKTLKIII